jgi:proline dehydrogenase
MNHAAANNYVLGVKLVRGAYVIQENEYHNADPSNHDTLPPVWSEKHETDACYNQCATMLLDNVTKLQPSSSTKGNTPQAGLLFGTHNRESCDIVMNELAKRDLATVVEDTSADGNIGQTLQLNRWVSSQVQFAQLYG